MYIDSNKFEILSQNLKIEFQDQSLIEKAFIHRSFPNEQSDKNLENNERLEFLGDAVIELIVTESLYKDFPSLKEGIMTSYRASLVRTENLANVARTLNFQNLVLMSKGEIASKSNNNDSILADVIESFVGAIYLDTGMESARKFIAENIYTLLPTILEQNLHIDPKTQLQSELQSRFKTTPEYEIVKEIGKDHEKVFEAVAKLNGKVVGQGSGRSKQLAETDAAKNALETLAISRQ